MLQFLAIRQGDGFGFVVPSNWRQNFEARGFKIHPAPRGLAAVEKPTPLSHVPRLPPQQKGKAVVAPPAAIAEPTILASDVPTGHGEGEAAELDVASPGVEAASPKPSRRRRKKKDAS